MNFIIGDVEFSTLGDGRFVAVDFLSDRGESWFYNTSAHFPGVKVKRLATWRNTNDNPAHGWDLALANGSGNASVSPKGGATAMLVEAPDGQLAIGVAICSATQNFSAKHGRGVAFGNALRALKKDAIMLLPTYQEYEFPEDVYGTIIEFLTTPEE